MVGGSATENNLALLLGNNIVILEVVRNAEALDMVQDGHLRVSALEEVGV
jgi:hypothetical protein